jgi:hypothetical protein
MPRNVDVREQWQRKQKPTQTIRRGQPLCRPNKAQKPITLIAAATPPNTDPPASTDQETGKWRKQKGSNVHHTNANVAPESGHVEKPTTQDGKTMTKRGEF